MLKRKVPVKVVKVKLLKNVRHFSVWQLLLFAGVFAGIGGYIIYHSFAATTTTTTSTWTTYASPWGDKSSDAGATINCANTKSASCLGSCFVTNGGTNGCRPWTTKTCPDGPNGSNVTNATIENSQIDQGVDYTVWDTASSCTYNNPNPADTNKSNGAKSITDTRVYAMGRGEITCVAGNPSTKLLQSLTLSQRCPGNGKVHVGAGVGTWLVYKLTDSGSGFPARGLKIYVSEACNLSRNAIYDVTTAPMTTKHRRWKVGDHVTPNSVLCEMPPSNGAMEMGWANEGRNSTPGGQIFKNDVYPAALKCFESKVGTYGYWSTAWGLSFNNFVLKYDGNRVAGYRGPNAYKDCNGFRKQAKYKINW
jgi:hypothetical protein